MEGPESCLKGFVGEYIRQAVCTRNHGFSDLRRFNRTCAVAGGTYILGKDFNIDYNEERQTFQIHVNGLDETLSSKAIVGEPSQLPKTLSIPPSASEKLVSRCIAIIDRPIQLVSPAPSPAEDGDQPEPGAEIPDIDSSVLVFPPGSVHGGSVLESVTAMITGEGSVSCPKGFCTCGLVLRTLVIKLTVLRRCVPVRGHIN